MSLYTAAAEGTGFEAPTASLVRAIGGHSALMQSVAIVDGQVAAPEILAHQNHDLAMMADYAAHYIHLDPWVPVAIAHRGRLVDVDRILPPDEFRRTPFFNEMGKRLEALHCLLMPFDLGDGGMAGIGVQRTARMGPFRPNDLRRAAFLQPHLRRALTLRFRLQKAPKAGDAASVVQALRQPAALLAQNGLLRVANDALLALVARRDGIDLAPGGSFHLADRAGALAFQAALGACLNPAGQAGDEIVVRRPSGAPPMLLALTPLRGGGALMLLTVPDKPPLLAPQAARLGAMFSLTDAEADLGARLAVGMPPAEAAAARGVSLHTVRVQIRSLLAKTGANGLRDLVALLGRAAG